MRALLLALLLLASASPAAAEVADLRFLDVRPVESGCLDDESPCWDVAEFVVPLGAHVALSIDLGGAEMPHNLRVLEPVDAATPLGEDGTVEFDATEAGVIGFVCEVHPATMHGRIRVDHPRVLNGSLATRFTMETVGLRVRVDATESRTTHPNATFAWDWGDGTPPGTGRVAEHEYAGTGEYALTLAIEEPDGARVSETRLVHARASSPPTVAPVEDVPATPVEVPAPAPALLLAAVAALVLARRRGAG